ncbi:hypothetical protein JOF53_007403 [Crossiella equi]|uniref:Uncharacterized protein n=1 Tax=Crossiella equi TaxID=130796 RepID=A0ABS5APN4_9PSEU|nr:hypothetical protein [Crossiella equi]MBP2478531.1 hypothetical protein [Crossiella equi]
MRPPLDLTAFASSHLPRLLPGARRHPDPEWRAAAVLRAGHKHRFDADHARVLTDPGLSPAERHLVTAVGQWVCGGAAVEPDWRYALARLAEAP